MVVEMLTVLKDLAPLPAETGLSGTAKALIGVVIVAVAAVTVVLVKKFFKK